MISKARLRRSTSRQTGVLGHPRAVATPQARPRGIARRNDKHGSPEDISVHSSTPAGATRLTHTESAEHKEEMRPLEFGLIRRVFTYMRPYRAKRNWLLLAVLV